MNLSVPASLSACLLWAVLLLPAMAASPVVATLDGEALTLLDIENELLRKEGRAELERIIEKRVEQLNFTTLAEEDILLELVGETITRKSIADALVAADQGKMRKELENITLVKAALSKVGNELDKDMLEAEWARQEKRFSERLKKAGGAGTASLQFEDYVRMQENMDKHAFMTQPRFTTAARLHAYVYKNAKIPEDVLKKHFTTHADRFGDSAAVDLSVIAIPFESKEIAGQTVIDRRHQLRLPKVMQTLHAQISKGTDFSKLWRGYGKAYDDKATDGRVGWVDRRGKRLDTEGPDIDPAVVTAAFAVPLDSKATLLPVIAYKSGVAIVRVERRREGKAPRFGAIVDAVRTDFIDSHLDQVTKLESRRLLKDVTTDPITERQVRDALLKRKGSAAVMRRIDKRLESIRWQGLSDEAVLLRIGPHAMRRIDLVVPLLREKGHEVRTALIRLRVTLKGLDAAKVTVTDADVQAEWQRLDVRARRDHDPKSPALRMAARTRAYVQNHSKIDEDDLRDHYVTYIDRFSQSEAAELSLITVAYKRNKDRSIDQAHARRVGQIIAEVHQEIESGKRTFADAWERYGKALAPHAKDGYIGWVNREGIPDTRGMRPVPATVMDAAFDADIRQGAKLLPIIAFTNGICLCRVERRREAKVPAYTLVRSRVRQDYISEHSDRLARKAWDDFLRAVEVTYEPWNPLVEAREAELTQARQPVQTPIP